MSVESIQEKQNEERMLCYQFAARWNYNRAERLNRFVWACCIIAWLTIFLPEDASPWFVAVPFSIDAIAAVLHALMASHVSSASALRKYFDAYVLDLDPGRFTEPEIRKLEELSFKAVNSSPNESKIQMANTGHDSPPGVRTWYEFSQPFPDEEAVFECLKQNGWWNKRLMRERLLLSIIEVIILLALAVIIISVTQASVFWVILSSSGLLLKVIERLVANKRYYTLSLNIDGCLDVLATCRSAENIRILQAKIDERRTMPVLEKNRIHKRRAKQYSELYQYTTPVPK